MELLLEGINIENQLINAMRNRYVIKFKYNGFDRALEVYCLGLNKKGNLVIIAWDRIASASLSRPKAKRENDKSGWRMFRVDKIKNIKYVTDNSQKDKRKRFISNSDFVAQERPKFNQKYRNMSNVFYMIVPGRLELYGSKAKSIKFPTQSIANKKEKETYAKYAEFTKTNKFPVPEKIKYDIEVGSVFFDTKNNKKQYQITKVDNDFVYFNQSDDFGNTIKKGKIPKEKAITLINKGDLELKKDFKGGNVFLEHFMKEVNNMNILLENILYVSKVLKK